MKALSTSTMIEEIMYPEIQTTLTYAELRAVIKSLSIGCDQLASKLERMNETKYRSGVESELTLLLEANRKFNGSLYSAITEMPS